MSERIFTAGIYTLGCKVNQYESEAVAEALVKEGFSILSPTESCDLYIINTCTVTAESDRKARQFIRRAIRRNPDAFVLVMGCLSQTRPETVAKIEGVDYVCGNADKLSVVREACRLRACGRKNSTPVIACPPPDSMGFECMQISHFHRTRAYVKIEDGCENRCTYCIIPSARGAVRSKPPAEVIAEVTALAAGGCREVVLTGIETASYGKDLEGCELAELLEAVDRIDGIERVRLGSLDPSLIKEPFAVRIAALKKLTPHFHLSMQSGSDKILARMKRKYNTKMALEAMERLRQRIPEVQFTTDMIVGFPGEGAAEFEETLRFAKKAGFLMIHVFPYSKRQGTPAALMEDQVEETDKHKRVAALSACSEEIRKEILDGEVGKTVQVLFERFSGGQASGHTPNFIEVSCLSQTPLDGEIRTVRIMSHDTNQCHGILTEMP